MIGSSCELLTPKQSHTKSERVTFFSLVIVIFFFAEKQISLIPKLSITHIYAISVQPFFSSNPVIMYFILFHLPITFLHFTNSHRIWGTSKTHVLSMVFRHVLQKNTKLLTPFSTQLLPQFSSCIWRTFVFSQSFVVFFPTQSIYFLTPFVAHNKQ